MTDALWNELEKLDVLRKRMGVGYREAREALGQAQGDVMQALENLEKALDDFGPLDVENERREAAEALKQGTGLWNDVKEAAVSFGGSTISLKKDARSLASIPAPLGVALAYTIWRKPNLRLLALVGAVGAVLNGFELEIAGKEKKGEEGS